MHIMPNANKIKPHPKKKHFQLQYEPMNVNNSIEELQIGQFAMFRWVVYATDS